MLLKLGVDISRLERNTRRAMSRTAVAFGLRMQEMVVTSTYEGNHSNGSLHYANQAFDVRTPAHSAPFIFRRIKEELGKDFDVIEEDTHFHIEYDPKG